MQTDMLVSGFPGSGYLSAASPMLVALCTYVSTILQMIWCVVPKCGGTVIQRFLTHSSPYRRKKMTQFEAQGLRQAKIFSDLSKMAELGFKYLNTFTKEQIEFRLNNYFKFMFTRHPFERVLSAYRDKVKHIPSYTHYGKQMLEGKPKNQSTRITFVDFVTYLIRKRKSVKYIDPFDRRELKYKNDLHRAVIEETLFNRHWDTESHLCMPCIVR